MFAKITSLVTGSSLPFTIGQDKGNVWNWWTLYSGTLRENASEVSIFKAVIPITDNVRVELARNCLKKHRTLKHPSIVGFKDSLESADRNNITFYLVTEPVTTLVELLEREEMQENAGEILAWGLSNVISGINFLNNECKMIHGNISLHSIFISEQLEWKLGLFDLLSEHGNFGKLHDPQPLMSGHTFVKPVYLPGEVHKKEWNTVSDSPPWSVDAWGLGCLIQEVFKGGELTEVSELRNVAQIPRTFSGDYQRLLSSNPSRRLNPGDLLETNSYFKTKLNDIMTFMQDLIIREEAERSRFFRGLPSIASSLPNFIVQKKILPACLSALEYGDVSSAGLVAVLQLLSQAGDSSYFEKGVFPFILKMLTSRDVMIKLTLLQNMDKYINFLTTQMIESKFYKGIQIFFKDSDPRIRDQTIKCISLLAPKMQQKTLNSSLLQHLAQLQRDPEAAIRTNTTVLISKISQYLGEASCKKVLLNAFTRVLSDPAGSVRIAGILALKETSQYYTEEDIARKIIPTLSPLLVDPDQNISVSSYKCLETNFNTLKAYIKKRESEIVPVLKAEPVDQGANLSSTLEQSQVLPQVNNTDIPSTDPFEGLIDDGNGWDNDDQFDDMLADMNKAPASEMDIQDQMLDLSVGMSGPASNNTGMNSRPSPKPRRKMVSNSGLKKSTPMKLGAVKRSSLQKETDGWGDLLNE